MEGKSGSVLVQRELDKRLFDISYKVPATDRTSGDYRAEMAHGYSW